MKKLRLLVTEKCNKTCEGCCNKEWDLKALPFCYSFKEYKEIILTGGEPTLLGLDYLKVLIEMLRLDNPSAKIYMYTTNINALKLPLDGVTLTIHDHADSSKFKHLNKILMKTKHPLCTSLRLHIFKESCFDRRFITKQWDVKDNLTWIKNCPLPKDEIFMKL